MLKKKSQKPINEQLLGLILLCREYGVLSIKCNLGNSAKQEGVVLLWRKGMLPIICRARDFR